METIDADVIVEEETTVNGEAVERKESEGFTKKLGNVLRQSKRLLRGKSRDKESVQVSSSSGTPASPGAGPLPSSEVTTPASEATVVNGHNGSVETESKQRKISQTFYSGEKEVIVDGKAIREIEVTGERSPEPMDTKKQKKVARRKSNDPAALNVACRDLGHADHEGWLLKKSGGHGLVPVSWKKLWCVVKNGSLYCYKTSFDLTALQMYSLQNYTCAVAAEKKKIALKLSPKPAADDGERKAAVFAGETEQEVNTWVELLNKVSSGIEISHAQDAKVPEYEDRKRLYSASPRLVRATDENGSTKRSSLRKAPPSSIFASNETTGMPAGFGLRTQSVSAPRVRKTSNGAAPGSSVLAVGSMFQKVGDKDEEDDSSVKDASLQDILYKSEEVEVEITPAMREEMHKLNAELQKLSDDMTVLKPSVRSSPPNTPVAPLQVEPVQTSAEASVAAKTQNVDVAAVEEVSPEVRLVESPRPASQSLFHKLEDASVNASVASQPTPSTVAIAYATAAVREASEDPSAVTRTVHIDAGATPVVERSVCHEAEARNVSPIATHVSEDVRQQKVDDLIASVAITHTLKEHTIDKREEEPLELEAPGPVDAGTKVTTSTEVFRDDDGGVVVVTTTVEETVVVSDSAKSVGVASVAADVADVQETVGSVSAPLVECGACESKAENELSALAGDETVVTVVAPVVECGACESKAESELTALAGDETVVTVVAPVVECGACESKAENELSALAGDETVVTVVAPVVECGACESKTESELSALAGDEAVVTVVAPVVECGACESKAENELSALAGDETVVTVVAPVVECGACESRAESELSALAGDEAVVTVFAPVVECGACESRAESELSALAGYEAVVTVVAPVVECGACESKAENDLSALSGEATIASFVLPVVECGMCDRKAEGDLSALSGDDPADVSADAQCDDPAETRHSLPQETSELDGEQCDDLDDPMMLHFEVTPIVSAPLDLGEDLDIPKLDSDSFADELNQHLRLSSGE